MSPKSQIKGSSPKRRSHWELEQKRRRVLLSWGLSETFRLRLLKTAQNQSSIVHGLANRCWSSLWLEMASPAKAPLRKKILLGNLALKECGSTLRTLKDVWWRLSTNESLSGPCKMLNSWRADSTCPLRKFINGSGTESSATINKNEFKFLLRFP